MPRGIKRKLTDAQLIPSSSKKQRATPASPTSLIPTPPDLSAIELLPTDVLVSIILRYIPISQWASMESISRRFRDCIYEAWRKAKEIRVFDDLLATTKYFQNKTSFVDVRTTTSVLNKLSLRAINLTSIGGISKLNHYKGVGSEKMELVCSYLIQFQKLRRFELDIGDCSRRFFDIPTFLTMHSGRANLTKLILPESIPRFWSDDERFADAFRNDHEGRAPLQLTTIDLRDNHENLGFGNCLSSSAFLQTIDVSRLTTFLISGTFVPRRKLSDFVIRAIKLERLSFSFACYHERGRMQLRGCHVETTRIALDENVAILDAIGKLEYLESLTIGTFNDLSGTSAAQSKRNCGCRDFLQPLASLLRILDARRSAVSGERIFKELGFINHLDESKFVSLIADYLPDLRALELDGTSDQLDDEVLGRALRSQHTLRRLHLDRHQRTVNIADILGSASTLECLSLSLSCGAYLRGDLKDLAAFQQLKEFKLVYGGCTYVMPPPFALDGSVFTTWSNGFGANLSTFEFFGRSNASVNHESLLQFLATTSAQLKVLGLRSLTIDDQFLANLATQCPHIEELYLRGDGPMMTKAGVQHLLDKCTRLKTIGFRVKEKNPALLKDLSLGKYRRVIFKEEVEKTC